MTNIVQIVVYSSHVTDYQKPYNVSLLIKRQRLHGDNITVKIHATKLQEQNKPQDITHVVETEPLTGSLTQNPYVRRGGLGNQFVKVHLCKDYVCILLQVVWHSAEYGLNA